MNYFEIFNLPLKFKMEPKDKLTLEESFLKLQKNLYTEQGVVDIRSSIVNQAYNTLKNDVSRALYILKLFGISLENFEIPPDVGEYIMEIMDDIADSETKTEVRDKILDLELELEGVIEDFDEKIYNLSKGKGITRQDILIQFTKLRLITDLIKKHKKDFACGGK